MVLFTRPEFFNRLLIRFPEHSRGLISEYFNRYDFIIKVTSPRKQKLGSFRSSSGSELPVISINNDLGEYSFLLVFIHELAHLKVWKEYGRKAMPHGREWKLSFQELTLPFLNPQILPDELIVALKIHFRKTPSSFHRDVQILRVLNRLEEKGEMLTLAEIGNQVKFQLLNGKQMIKLERMRTRYKCFCPSNKRYYLVSPTAQIILI